MNLKDDPKVVYLKDGDKMSPINRLGIKHISETNELRIGSDLKTHNIKFGSDTYQFKNFGIGSHMPILEYIEDENNIELTLEEIKDIVGSQYSKFVVYTPDHNFYSYNNYIKIEVDVDETAYLTFNEHKFSVDKLGNVEFIGTRVNGRYAVLDMFSKILKSELKCKSEKGGVILCA